MLQAVGNGRSFGRLGISVAKRYVKRAVDRNWVRRAIRESYRQHEIRTDPIDVLVSIRAAPVHRVRWKKTLITDILRLLNRGHELEVS
jgi:ribonuclease P protein component